MNLVRLVHILKIYNIGGPSEAVYWEFPTVGSPFHVSFVFLSKEYKFSSWFWEKLRAKGSFLDFPVAWSILAGKQIIYFQDLENKVTKWK